MQTEVAYFGCILKVVLQITDFNSLDLTAKVAKPNNHVKNADLAYPNA